MGRKVDFDLFEREGFEIGRRIRELGWERVCSLDLPTYPALVKEFYANLSRGDGGIVSSVRGRRIHLTSESLAALLEIPLAGDIVNMHDDRSGALSRMLGREVADFEEVRANQLPLELRLLHNICSRIFFPKTGRFEYVSERDIVLMDCVLTGQPINLAAMMIWYIAEAGSKKRATLPYGMVLTLVFRSQGVVILDSEPKKTLRHTDYYSLATLHRMGFVKIDGHWDRKGQLEERITDIGASAPSEAGPSQRQPSPEPTRPSSPPAPAAAPAPTFASSSSDGFTAVQLAQLKELFTSHEERLKADFDSRLLSFRELCYSLEERVSSIESTLESSSETLKKDILSIVSKLKDIGGDSQCYSQSNAELQESISSAMSSVEKIMNAFMEVQTKGMGQILEILRTKLQRMK